jgi:Uma2 family endonuclease
MVFEMRAGAAPFGFGMLQRTARRRRNDGRIQFRQTNGKVHGALQNEDCPFYTISPTVEQSPRLFRIDARVMRIYTFHCKVLRDCILGRSCTMRQAQKNYFTPAQYLAMEVVSEEKHEYYDGEIYLMAGGTREHSLIAVNVVSELRQALAPKPCEVYNSDMRLLVERSGLYTYPDVMVICGKVQMVERRNDTVTNPVLIVEVLSESTRNDDRGVKFNFYKQLPSLQEYVVVESERPRVEVYRRGENDVWALEALTDLEAVLHLASVDCQVSLNEVYRKVSWL